MTATVTAMLNAARSQLGVREGANNDTIYGSWFGLNHEPYCAMGLSWAANQCGATGIMHGRWASCPQWMKEFQASHEFLPWSITPHSGDIVFFDWSGHHAYPVHVGIVESVDPDGVLVTIEFNTTSGFDPGTRESYGGGVWRRRRTRAWVVGYGRPHYAAQTPPVPAPHPGAGRVPLVIDGVWGPLTTARLQTWLGHKATGSLSLVNRKALQKRLRVTADGVWGPITHKALQGFLNVAQDGAWGPITVKALQRFLNRAVS